MSSSSCLSHATITYTSVSSCTNGSPWGIHLIPGYESEAPEAVPQSLDQTPFSPVHTHEYPEYLAQSDNDLPIKDQLLQAYASQIETEEDPGEEDPEEDLSKEEEDLAMALSALAL
ncbi:hypothetical protein Tco_0235233, partial [Tanacetum coccineum]